MTTAARMPDEMAGLDLDLLEPLLRDWVRLIGLPATLAIVQAHGGLLLNIARKADENADLVALIGTEKAAILGREYGGERPLVPKALPALNALRNQRMRADRATKSVRQIAREHRLGERRAWQILGSAPEATGDLFD